MFNRCNIALFYTTPSQSLEKSQNIVHFNSYNIPTLHLHAGPLRPQGHVLHSLHQYQILMFTQSLAQYIQHRHALHMWWRSLRFDAVLNGGAGAM